MLWLAVALGGAVGATIRFGVAVWLPIRPGEFPVATYGVNIAGSFLAGVLYVLIVEKGLLMPHLRPPLMVGMLGALTTYSTFSLESVLMLRDGDYQLALGYMLSTFICCVLATVAGLGLTSKIF